MLSQANYQKWLNGELDKPETNTERAERLGKQKAESHRATWEQMIQRHGTDFVVETLIKFEALTLKNQTLLGAARVEIGRLRKLIKTVSGATGIKE